MGPKAGGAIVAAVIGLLLLVVWYSGRTPSAAPEGNESAGHVWHLRMGHNMPVDSAMHEAALLYAKRVYERSGGRLVVAVFPNQELGDDHRMLEMARRGELDIVLTPTAKMSIALPSMQYVDLPFYFPTRDDLYAMLDGEPGRMLLDELRQIDLIGVTFWENGFKHFTANTPLLRADDFHGKTFRIMKSRLIRSQFEALGAQTLPIDFHETRKALSDGVVDGQENPLIAIRSMGFDTVQSDLTLSSHAYMGYVFSISDKTFRTLPSDLQSILYRTAVELTPFEREETHKREAALLAAMRREGMRIHELSPSERDDLSRRLAPIASAYEEVIGPHILAKTQEILQTKYAPSPESGKQIVIGLDVDLSSSSRTGGLAIKRGAELAVDAINRRGGVLGKPLVLLVKDNRGTASKGEENVRSMIARPDVAAIIGGVRSNVIEASLDTVRKAGIPYLIPWATSGDLINGQTSPSPFFRISINNRDAMTVLMRELSRHSRRPAIVYENSAWGRDSFRRAAEILAHDHRTFAYAAKFSLSQEHFDSEVEGMVRARADAVLLIANPIEGEKVVNTMSLHRCFLPVISHWGVTSNHFFPLVKESLKSIDFQFLQTFLFTQADTPQSRELGERYCRRYGLSNPAQIAAPSGVAQAYDTVELLAQAIDRAKSTEHSAVRDALEDLPAYRGIVRDYDPPFTPSRHEGLQISDIQMARFRSDGTIVPVADRNE